VDAPITPPPMTATLIGEGPVIKNYPIGDVIGTSVPFFM